MDLNKLPETVLAKIFIEIFDSGSIDPSDVVYIFLTAYETIFFPLKRLKQYFILRGVCRHFKQLLSRHDHFWFVLRKKSPDDIIFIVNLPGVANETENWGYYTKEKLLYEQRLKQKYGIGHTLTLEYPLRILQQMAEYRKKNWSHPSNLTFGS